MNREIRKLKQVLKIMKGEEMSELREVMNTLISDVRDGKIPLDTAEVIHKMAHRHVMDRYADVAQEKASGNGMIERTKKLMEEL